MIVQTPEGFRVDSVAGGSVYVNLIDDVAYLHSLTGPGLTELAAELDNELKRLDIDVAYATVDIYQQDLLNVYMKRWDFQPIQVMLMKNLKDIDQEIKEAK